MDELGVLYLAIGGQRYLEEASASAQSVRSHMPDIPIACISDGSEPEGIFDMWLPYCADVDASEYGARGGFLSKIDGLSQTPFHKTLFLDTDTRCCYPVWEFFSSLMEYDLVAVHAPFCSNIDWKSVKSPQRYILDKSFVPHINTGVLAYNKNPITAGLFNIWKSKFRQRFNALDSRFSDQTVFQETLIQAELRALFFPCEYNLRVSLPATIHGHARILHGRPKIGLQCYERLFNAFLNKRVTLGGLGMFYVSDNHVCYRFIEEPDIEKRYTFQEYFQLFK